MRAMLGGLRRLADAPGLWLGTWLGLMLGAALVGGLTRIVLAASLGPFDALEVDHLLFGLADALTEHRGAAATVGVAVVTSGLASASAWMVLAPVVIARLAGTRGRAQLGAIALRHLPAVVVQSLWHGVLRAAAIIGVVVAGGSLPTAGLGAVLGLVWLVCTTALDVTRVTLVEYEAAPLHPRTAWRGFMLVARRPRLLLPTAALSLGQLVLTATVGWLALAHLHHGSVWLPRLLALVSVGLGLWRVGTVLQHLKDTPPPASTGG